METFNMFYMLAQQPQQISWNAMKQKKQKIVII